jgi:galactokinase
MKTDLQKEFRNRFQQEAEHIFFCPGRVNLIGEHIDYNGGKVMPCAISLGTWLAVCRNQDKMLRFESLNFPERTELRLQSSYSKTKKDWFNYPLGVINQLLQKGHTIPGMNMLFYGNLPIGAGLSSSASIEMLTFFALNTISSMNISIPDAAVLCKKVENEFIGVNSGIMDQFAVGMGKKNRAILLDCDTLEYQYLPFETGDHSLIIINSNKGRTLADSKYNERFTECGKALKALKKELPIHNLCEIDSAAFESHRHLIDDPVLEKRAQHVITENERVHEAVKVLEQKNIEAFGQLMYASHQSLKELYEVSGKELDTIVDFCKTFNGCIGARMTGAGFGGCAIALIDKNKIGEFSGQLSKNYTTIIGYEPQVFQSEIGNGVQELSLKEFN